MDIFTYMYAEKTVMSLNERVGREGGILTFVNGPSWHYHQSQFWRLHDYLIPQEAELNLIFVDETLG